MKLENQFEVPLSADQTWATLMNIERIVTCVPGAELVEVIDDRTYKGKVSVKLGPVALAFLGTAKFVEIDEIGRTATVKAQGADQKGRGGANANVRFMLTSIDDGTRVNVDTDLNLSGSVAQYGRASGMIDSVAAEITNQFASTLRKQIEHIQKVETTSGSTVTATAPLPSAKPISGFSLFLKALVRRLAGMFGKGG